jgi:hypothetical protein
MESEPISGSQPTGPVEKVQVVVLPADNLPGMSNNKFMVATSHNISYVSNFLKSKLKSQLGENDTLVCFFKFYILSIQV